MKNKILFRAVLALGCCALLAPNHALSQSGYHLLKKTVIGGEGGWDYLSVDEQNRRLYISHGTKVEVLNADNHEKIGIVGGLQGVHGAIAVPSKGRGITTNGRTGNLTIFDLATLKVVAEIPAGKNPDALLYDPFSDRVYVFNHSGGDVTVVDIGAAKVTGTVVIGGDGLEAGVSDGKGTIFVNLEDSHEIVSFDTKTLAVRNRWKLTPGEEPTGLAYDAAHHRLFSACHNELLIVLDSETGKVVGQVPIGKRVDGVVFDPFAQVAITSNGEGTITVVKEVSPDEFKVLETVKTAVGARTITLDPRTHHVFLSSADFGETPAPTTDNPRPRPKVVPGSFFVMEIGVR